MTQQEIQERSEQIALMLGYVNTTPADKDFNIFEYPTKFGAIPKMIETMSMKFHSDWNWLMEAVEFVKKTSGISMVQGPVKKPTCVIHLGDLKALSGQSNTLKEAVFIAVSDFAKLYNERKL